MEVLGDVNGAPDVPYKIYYGMLLLIWSCVIQLFSEELLGLPARGVAQHRAGHWDCHFHIRHLASQCRHGRNWLGTICWCGCAGCGTCFLLVSHTGGTCY